MTEREQIRTDLGRSAPGPDSLRPVSREGDPMRGGAPGPAAGTAADVAGSGSAAPTRRGAAAEPIDGRPVEDLESEVYAARDLHGDERGEVGRTLVQARSRMSDTTYRRALVLARDSVLLSIDECLDGAAAMEWEPTPRPEFSLEARTSRTSRRTAPSDRRASIATIR
jgi:hypothetical protein